jgi:hypothetical protein
MKKNIILFITLFSGFVLHAQQIKPDVVNATGGSAQYSGGYLAWSVGEPVIGSIAGSNASINQGFLQTWPALAKNIMLTFYLEGLWNGSSLNKAQNDAGDAYPGDVADKVQIELHKAANYNEVVYTAPGVNLNTAGQASVTVPAIHTGSYYLAVKHRNSIETVSALPLALSGTSINYDFTDNADKAFGDNMKALDGIYVIYGGDVNQDGVVDGLDMIPVDNQAANFGNGYIPEDINGDGSIDALDMIVLDNNAAGFVSAVLP